MWFRLSAMGLIALIIASQPGTAAQCAEPPDTSTAEWRFLFNNAARTADDYAVRRNPAATFVSAEADILYQYGGAHEGSYLVRLMATGQGGTDFALLLPAFDVCGDVTALDDSRTDLFSVVVAKHDGREF